MRIILMTKFFPVFFIPDKISKNKIAKNNSILSLLLREKVMLSPGSSNHLKNDAILGKRIKIDQRSLREYLFTGVSNYCLSLFWKFPFQEISLIPKLKIYLCNLSHAMLSHHYLRILWGNSQSKREV